MEVGDILSGWYLDDGSTIVIRVLKEMDSNSVIATLEEQIYESTDANYAEKKAALDAYLAASG
tara:strand:- start:283 stop:471 length:189 start_codon:yes stop_codon:yes gene_type:complete